jgi:peptide/nickel transport system substrate-binding protein
MSGQRRSVSRCRQEDEREDRGRLRPVERAAFIKEYSEKKHRNIIQAGPGAFGNAATRIEAHLVRGGVFSYGSYPDIDAL